MENESLPNSSQNKILIIIVILLVGVLGGYFIWQYWLAPEATETSETKAVEEIAAGVEKAVESATSAALPSINPQSNPLENAPNVNPMERANPFKEIKTNPFAQ